MTADAIPEVPGAFCSLCGNTNPADLGRVIGICLDKDACHQRQYAKLRGRAEVAETKLADLQDRWDTCWRALWIMVRQFGGSVFLTAKQLDEVPLLASLGYGREPSGLRINAEEEP